MLSVIQITLDGQKATEKEIDTVSVLQALKLARQETSSKTNLNPTSEVRNLGKFKICYLYINDTVNLFFRAK